MLSGYRNGKPRYWSGNGKTWILDKDGHAIRKASEGEAQRAEKIAWEELWDDFGGTGLDDDDDDDDD